LRNLIENAVRYGSAASVTWVLGDDDLVITVEDVGPGIPAENFDQVFDPFFRLEKSRSLETGGHGLGLSIARSIVRAHGGEITMSNRERGGLAVNVQLPLVAIQLREGD
jgi:signal transduction histidine kinase